MPPKKTVQPVSRAEQKMITRQRLLESTYDIIAEEGLAATTLSKVAKNAGLSQGIGNFHFKSKEKLLVETLKYYTQTFKSRWQKAIDDAGPQEINQLIAFIKALLTPPITDYEQLAVWHAYVGETAHKKNYLELCGESDRALENICEVLCEKLLEDETDDHILDPRTISLGLVAMLGGFSFDLMMTPDQIDSSLAIRSCLGYVLNYFPDKKSQIITAMPPLSGKMKKYLKDAV